MTISCKSDNGGFVLPAPFAAFLASQTSLNEGETVNFTDQSLNSPASWFWNFGDGETSVSQNPSHTYNTAGRYTVSLTIANNYGTSTKNSYINVMDTLTGSDGNTYNTVIIGTQVWMSENLKTTKYNDGTNIANETEEWKNLSTPAYCWYDNNEVTYKNLYGTLYNWYVIETGNVCPTG